MGTRLAVLAALALLAVILLGAAAPSAPAPANGGFDRWFVDRTLRVDYYHVGHKTEEFVTLDRVSRQGAWAGSTTHLVDTFDNGGYYVKVYDLASGTLIYSRGFDSYFGEYRTSGPAEKGVRRTYHETALIPAPKAKVRFALEVRGRDKKLAPLFETEIDPASFTIAERAPLPGVKVVDALISGDPHHKVDVAMVAEGYTAAEEGKFRKDLERFTGILFKAEPFARLKDRFNVRGVFVPSAESGCDEPSRGVYRNTAVGASFDSLGSERYLLTENDRALRDIAGQVPYDAIYVMVNQARYGGGGIYNFFCTFTTDNQWSPYVFVHEFGHAFAGLADEYYTASVAYNEFYPKGVEPTEPNITALLPGAPLKWADLVTPGTPVPTPWEKAPFDTLDKGYQKVRGELNEKIAARMRAGAPAAEVAALKEQAEALSKEAATKVDAFLAQSAWAGKVGAFEGAGYASEGLSRAMLDCIMFSKGSKPFCRVCDRAIARVIEHYE